MTRGLHVRSVGPSVTIQDAGRPGYLAEGLSRGGAVDRLALLEGAALLRQSENCAALEMAAVGGVFEATEDLRVALTGAPMRATIEGRKAAWNASHLLQAGSKLSIGAVDAGCYGYLHIGGGIQTEPLLGSRSVHLAAGIGGRVAAGDFIEAGPERRGDFGLKLDCKDRLGGGSVRIVASLQTDLFSTEEIDRFERSRFQKDIRANRMGVRLHTEHAGFESKVGLSVVSEIIVPGDIQITGDGTPYVLLSECQTTGGYRRIGSVLPSDLPRVVQAQAGEDLWFRFVSLEEAIAIEARYHEDNRGLKAAISPLIRDPASMPDLLAYQLISGVTAGDDVEWSANDRAH